jgi:hypothetical protein
MATSICSWNFVEHTDIKNVLSQKAEPSRGTMSKMGPPTMNFVKLVLGISLSSTPIDGEALFNTIHNHADIYLAAIYCLHKILNYIEGLKSLTLRR